MVCITLQNSRVVSPLTLQVAVAEAAGWGVSTGSTGLGVWSLLGFRGSGLTINHIHLGSGVVLLRGSWDLVHKLS